MKNEGQWVAPERFRLNLRRCIHPSVFEEKRKGARGDVVGGDGCNCFPNCGPGATSTATADTSNEKT